MPEVSKPHSQLREPIEKVLYEWANMTRGRDSISDPAFTALDSLIEQLETAREALERISTYGSHYTPHTGIARDALDALNPASRSS